MATNIYTDLYNIKNELTEFIKKDLQLDGVNISKSGYLGYIIDQMSKMTSNIGFFSSMNYKENFLITAQLQESIYNWASYLSYVPQLAIPSKVDAMISFPLEFDEYIWNIQKSHKFYSSDDIEFMTEYDYEITYRPSFGDVKILQKTTSEMYSLPYLIKNNKLSFVMPLIQKNIYSEEFTIPALELYQFFIINMNHPDYISNIKLYYSELNNPDQNVDGDWEEWEFKDKLYLMEPNKKQFSFRKINEDEIQIILGNTFYGFQPKENAKILVKLETTKGEDGRIENGFIVRGDRIQNIDSVSGQQEEIVYSITNINAGYGGVNSETFNETRQNAIVHNVSRQRLVTENDYNNLTTIIKDLPFVDTVPILKRSDLKTNDVNVYAALKFKDKLIPTYSETVEFDPNEEQTTWYPPYTEYTEEWEDAEGNTYSFPLTNPFGLYINEDKFQAEHIYIVNDIDLAPTVKYDDNVDVYPVAFTNLHVYTSDDYNSITFDLNYMLADNTFSMATATCDLELHMGFDRIDGPYSMSLDEPNNLFTITLDTFEDLYDGEITAKFIFKDNGIRLGTVSASGTFIHNLKDFMLSWIRDTFEEVYSANIINYDSGGNIISSHDDNASRDVNWNCSDVLYSEDHPDPFMSNELAGDFNYILVPVTFDGRYYNWNDGTPHTLDTQDPAPWNIQWKDEDSKGREVRHRHQKIDDGGGAYTIQLETATIYTTRTIYEIPVIGKEWADSLTLQEGKELELDVIQKLIYTFRLTNEYRMLNSFANLKFCKTFGPILSLYDDKNSFDNIMKDIVTSVPSSPDENDKYLIMPGATGVFSDHINEIAKWNGTDWEYIQADIGTYIRYNWDSDDLEVLLQSVMVLCADMEWREPYQESNMFIDVVVTVDARQNEDAIIKLVKDTLLELNNDKKYTGLKPHIYRSTLYKVIHDLPEVVHCEFLNPYFNIFYNIDLNMAPQEILARWVPEFAYFDPDRINVRVIRERFERVDY